MFGLKSMRSTKNDLDVTDEAMAYERLYGRLGLHGPAGRPRRRKAASATPDAEGPETAEPRAEAVRTADAPRSTADASA